MIEGLAKFMDANKCAYRWSPGQFCIVDNTVAYHSRQPFSGRRRVFAAIGKGQKEVKDTTT
jgi:alpha-ketoglutarate-dependent taurine dioxygenase